MIQYTVAVHKEKSAEFECEPGVLPKLYHDHRTNLTNCGFIFNNFDTYLIYTINTDEENMTMIMLRYDAFIYDPKVHGKVCWYREDFFTQIT